MDIQTGRSLFEPFHPIMGYIYPNESVLIWSILIVIYPYLVGLEAGAFILVSLEKVFKFHDIRPIQRLAMLTSLSLLLVAPLPLLFHLEHPLRGFEILITPHWTSPMAMFGFVYGAYLIVMFLEIWYNYRADLVGFSKTKPGWMGRFYGLLTLGVKDTSEKALAIDQKAGKVIGTIGIPAALFLPGYVALIFSTVKSNPWWGSAMMSVNFMFSAIVSGIALMMVVYFVTSLIRKVPLQMPCLDVMGKFLFYLLIVDFALEGLDGAHRFYASEESLNILFQLVFEKLFQSLIVIQLGLGTLLPLALLGSTQAFKIPEKTREWFHLVSAFLVLIGVFADRCNMVIGGQLFSKSWEGLRTFEPELWGREGFLIAGFLLILPFLILWVLTRLLPPWLSSTKKSS